jgi:hypothetical protein
LLQLFAGFPERPGGVGEMDRPSTSTKRCQFGFNQVENVHRTGAIEPKLNRHRGVKFRNTLPTNSPSGSAAE